MITIYKFPIQITDEQQVEMPLGSVIRCAQMQNGTLCLWAMVNTNNAQKVGRAIRIVGTGHPITENPNDLLYIGTVQDHRGLVWHVHEKLYL